ncbi:MAG: ribose 5-phosphate isomerase B [Candidatus Melainabacteria bacterium HGW-Melainabacteria-1]|nr:MAG: ribose 5-phosphate isomerase B [Candidatus Melainabacteria bacterium HGW-Melainabacteria-1]
MKLAIGSDHGGYELKEKLKDFIRKEFHYEVIDYGCHSTEAVDYPDFAFLVAAAVAEGQCQLGIMIDGAGLGSSIVANKLPGVRAAVCNDLFAARNSRAHNQANVLTLGANIIGKGLAEEIVRVWLNTPFEERHQKRIDKILRLEREIYGFGKNG